MVTLGAVMSTDVQSVNSVDSVERVREFLAHQQLGAATVLDEAGELCGIVSTSDVVNALDGRVARVMSTELCTMATGVTATDAAAQMLEHRIHHIVVTESGEVVGMVSSFDLLRVLAGEVKAAAAHRSASAQVGDRIVIRSHAAGMHERRGTITEARGVDGTPPYMVQWLDDPHDEPHEVLFFPGVDADIEPPD